MILTVSALAWKPDRIPRADAYNLATVRHDFTCGKIHGDDWHIRNDYLPKAARDLAAEYRLAFEYALEALEELSR